MADRTYPRISLRAGGIPGLAEHLIEASDQGANDTVRRDLERYYALLAVELATISLTEAEALLVTDASNGVWWDPTSIRLLWAEVSDAIRLSGLADKWRVDGAALVTKLQTLTPGQAYALVDAIERAWRDPRDDMPAILRERGVIR